MEHNLYIGQMMPDMVSGGQAESWYTSVLALQIISGVLLVALLIACFFMVQCKGKCRAGVTEEARKDMGEQLDSILGTKKTDTPKEEVEMGLAEQPLPARETVIVTAPVEKTEPTVAKEPTSVNMDEIMQGLQDEDLRELVRDRLEQISRRTEDWALEMVDSLGEMESLKTEISEDAQSLHTICTEMRRQLTELGCEVIDSDEWNSERQRAIKTEQTLPPGSAPQITRKVSFGLCVQGRLVRKQEVCINK